MISKSICNIYDHIVRMDQMLFYDVCDVQCYGENLSLMAKIDLIVETCGGNCFFLTAIGIYCLLRATSGVLHLWDG